MSLYCTYTFVIDIHVTKRSEFETETNSFTLRTCSYKYVCWNLQFISRHEYNYYLVGNVVGIWHNISLGNIIANTPFTLTSTDKAHVRSHYLVVTECLILTLLVCAIISVISSQLYSLFPWLWCLLTNACPVGDHCTYLNSGPWTPSSTYCLLK